MQHLLDDGEREEHNDGNQDNPVLNLHHGGLVVSMAGWRLVAFAAFHNEGDACFP